MSSHANPCLSQPFCDGAHKAKAPSISPLRFSPEKDRTVMLCACKETKNAPYCDGSHFKVIFRDVVKSVKGVFKWSSGFNIECTGGHKANRNKTYLGIVIFVICLRTSVQFLIKMCYVWCLCWNNRMCCITLSCSSLTDRFLFLGFVFLFFYIAVLAKPCWRDFDCQSKNSC